MTAARPRQGDLLPPSAGPEGGSRRASGFRWLSHAPIWWNLLRFATRNCRE